MLTTTDSSADPFNVLNLIGNAASATGNTAMSGNIGASRDISTTKKSKKVADPMELLNAPPKQTLQTMSEFIIDCYCAQLHNIHKNGEKCNRLLINFITLSKLHGKFCVFSLQEMTLC
jgi:hypothetical protein